MQSVIRHGDEQAFKINDFSVTKSMTQLGSYKELVFRYGIAIVMELAKEGTDRERLDVFTFRRATEDVAKGAVSMHADVHVAGPAWRRLAAEMLD